ncbi:MAG: hypothetical protein ACPGSL_09495 [Vicingaceae bacterium]
MKSFNSVVLTLLLLSSVSCKNVEHTPGLSNEISIIKKIKTPLGGGMVKGGMKISLTLQKETKVQLDSIVYNKKAAEINEVKQNANTVWVESYFYNEKKMIEGMGMKEYKAEGNSCRLFYTINGKSKSILVTTLELKNEETLWE